MAKSITSANSILTIALNGGSPVSIQGYAADEAFMQEAIKHSETTMGVDGRMSAGYAPQEAKLKIKLSPDSDSKSFFDQWFSADQSAREVAFADALLRLPATRESYTFTRGVLSSWPGLPAGKKKLEPVEFELTFESVTTDTF